MNILTDILSLIRQGKYSKVAEKNDVLVLGKWNEQPDMTGVASPIPYKAVKLIKISDFKVQSTTCDYKNVPDVPVGDTGIIFQNKAVDAETGECTVTFRTLKSLSTNLTLALSADNNYVEINTTGEPNLAANVGAGSGIWKDKVGEKLNFKSLVAGPNLAITETADEITITSTAVPYTSYVQLLTQNDVSAPSGPILENSANITITWTYNTTGQFVATYSTPLTDVDKTAVRCSQTVKTSSGDVSVSVTSSFATGFNIVSEDTNGAGVNSQLLRAVLEIRIYP